MAGQAAAAEREDHFGGTPRATTQSEEGVIYHRSTSDVMRGLPRRARLPSITDSPRVSRRNSWHFAGFSPTHIELGTRRRSSHDSRDPQHQRSSKIAVENRDPLRKLRDEKVKRVWESHEKGLHSWRRWIGIPIGEVGGPEKLPSKDT